MGFPIYPSSRLCSDSFSYHQQGRFEYKRENASADMEGFPDPLPRDGFMMKEWPHTASSWEILGCTSPPSLEISLRKCFGSRDFFWSGRLRCTTQYFQTRGASVWILSSLFTNRIHLKHKTPRHWKNLKPIICYTWYNVSLIHRERRSGKLTPAQEKHLKANPHLTNGDKPRVLVRQKLTPW